jgi:methyltransferase FkbM-like protein
MGYHAGIKSNDKDVRALIGKLKPVDCGIELIRLGQVHDGGYLIPNDLDGIEYCFSPGVSDRAGFEDQLADRHIRSFLADYSVDRPPVTRPEFTFDKKFLGALDEEPYFTLATWKDKYLKDYTGDLILQMDIEGYEYEVILGMPDHLLDQFRIIIVEFHGVDRIFDNVMLPLMNACFAKLLQRFYVAHIHANNAGEVVRRADMVIPSLMEFTFLNKKRARSVKPQTVFPHPLDAQNSLNRKPIVLSEIWYS